MEHLGQTSTDAMIFERPHWSQSMDSGCYVLKLCIILAVGLCICPRHFMDENISYDHSAKHQSQHTLQTGQSVGGRFCTWVGVQIPSLEAFLVIKHDWFRFHVTYY